jgi:hypothetical protein
MLAEILKTTFVVDGIDVYLPLWTAETSIISFAAHVPLVPFTLKAYSPRTSYKYIHMYFGIKP